MNKYTKRDIASIIEAVEQGTFDRRNIKGLFFDLRPYLQEGDPIKDIAHFIAHPDARTRGLTFEYVQAFVNHFIWIAYSGGTLVVKPVFTQEIVISQLVADLLRLKFTVNKDLFTVQSARIMQCIFEIVEETPFRCTFKFVEGKTPEALRHTKVKDAILKGTVVNGKKKILAFNFKVINFPPGRVLELKDDVTYAVPAFELEEVS